MDTKGYLETLVLVVQENKTHSNPLSIDSNSWLFTYYKTTWHNANICCKKYGLWSDLNLSKLKKNANVATNISQSSSSQAFWLNTQGDNFGFVFILKFLILGLLI